MQLLDPLVLTQHLADRGRIGRAARDDIDHPVRHARPLREDRQRDGRSRRLGTGLHDDCAARCEGADEFAPREEDWEVLR